MSWIRRFPAHYSLPGFGFITSIIFRICEYRIAAWLPDWTKAIPWDWIALCLVAFMIGEIFRDWKNPNSFIKSHWDHWQRCFDVEGHYNASEHRDNRTYLNISVRLTFARFLEKADLFLKVYEIGREPRFLFTHTLVKETNVNVDEQRTYILAVIPVEPGENAYWGSRDNQTQHFLSEGSEYIAALCLRTKNRHQEHKIYIQIPWRSGHNFGRVCVFDERYAVLDWLRKPTLDTPGV